MTVLTPSYLVIEVNNIGYQVFISLHTFEQLSNDFLKKNIHIYTKAIYKENAADLYGFFTQEELELFSFLILSLQLLLTYYLTVVLLLVF